VKFGFFWWLRKELSIGRSDRPLIGVRGISLVGRIGRKPFEDSENRRGLWRLFVMFGGDLKITAVWLATDSTSLPLHGVRGISLPLYGTASSTKGSSLLLELVDGLWVVSLSTATFDFCFLIFRTTASRFLLLLCLLSSFDMHAPKSLHNLRLSSKSSPLGARWPSSIRWKKFWICFKLVAVDLSTFTIQDWSYTRKRNWYTSRISLLLRSWKHLTLMLNEKKLFNLLIISSSNESISGWT